jgi:hypothetical protein
MIDELCIKYLLVRCEQALGDGSQETDDRRKALHTKIFLGWDGPDGSRHEVGKMAIERGYDLVKERTTTWRP